MYIESLCLQKLKENGSEKIKKLAEMSLKEINNNYLNLIEKEANKLKVDLR